jgi:hypothetical protein
MTENNPFTELNTDDERERIIFGERIDYDGAAYFSGDEYATGDPISTETAQVLIDEHYVAPESSQNRAPTARELVETARAYDARTSGDVHASLCGYVIPARRPDARVMFTTVRLESRGGFIPEDVQTDIRTEFERGPDELYTTDTVVRCWWD